MKEEGLLNLPSSENSALALAKSVLRMHQWSKNILLFVPILAAHQITHPATWGILVLAFLSFSLCASAVYITNDLLDLEHDRQHSVKCHRPFACGAVSVRAGVLLAGGLLVCSIVLALFTSYPFLMCLLFYFFVTCLYSCGLKRLIVIDCLTLAMFYTIRIIAGAAAAGITLSFWLLAFSVFLFLSLAFVKRYAELNASLTAGKVSSNGRGYLPTDAPLVQTLGITSGYISALVLALYLNSHEVLTLYKTPEFIWMTVPVLLFWVSWMWLQAHRGHMHDDPVIHALKDKSSLLAGVAFAVTLILGTISWPSSGARTSAGGTLVSGTKIPAPLNTP